MRCTYIALLTILTAMSALAADPPAKPRVAVFPLAGDASADLREKINFSIRSKLSRDGTYDVIDGVTITELTATAPSLAANPLDLAKLIQHEKPAILIWGEITGGTAEGQTGATIRLKLLDLRQTNAQPVAIEKKLADFTELRLVSEQIVQSLPGVDAARQPNEQAVIDDETSRTLWAKNPNLVANGEFSDAGAWTANFKDQTYLIKPAETLPATDQVGIFKPAAKKGENHVLAMTMSRNAAESTGMACLSNPIRIEPGRRYRLSFRYKSDGPIARVFVKGYTMGKDITGKQAEREIFRMQVPRAGPTDGKWQTITADINPYHVSLPVQTLRVDLYTYLNPGVILWDDVVVKEVGPLTRKPQDAAIEKPLQR